LDLAQGRCVHEHEKLGPPFAPEHGAAATLRIGIYIERKRKKSSTGARFEVNAN
jgi:hypothetical protein